MAFGLFGRRRRDAAPQAPAEELAAVLADPTASVTPPENDPEASEAMLPRWRRPSLLQARRADSFRDVAPAPRLTFDQGLVGPADGRERRLIRYRLVRMLDTPDELRGTEIGYLDRGDEVQMLEKYGAYWLILCPDGRQGWVHNMTLGEVVSDFGQIVGEQVPSDRPLVEVSLEVETWTMATADENHDGFDAYLESRRRAL